MSFTLFVYSIDSTHGHGCGMMINDSCKPNCKVIVEETTYNEPKLAEYTIRLILKGEVLRFDYKDLTALFVLFAHNHFNIGLY